MDSERERLPRARHGGARFEPLKTTRYIADQCCSPGFSSSLLRQLRGLLQFRYARIDVFGLDRLQRMVQNAVRSSYSGRRGRSGIKQDLAQIRNGCACQVMQSRSRPARERSGFRCLRLGLHRPLRLGQPLRKTPALLWRVHLEAFQCGNGFVEKASSSLISSSILGKSIPPLCGPIQQLNSQISTVLPSNRG